MDLFRLCFDSVTAAKGVWPQTRSAPPRAASLPSSHLSTECTHKRLPEQAGVQNNAMWPLCTKNVSSFHKALKVLVHELRFCTFQRQLTTHTISISLNEIE